VWSSATRTCSKHLLFCPSAAVSSYRIVIRYLKLSGAERDGGCYMALPLHALLAVQWVVLSSSCNAARHAIKVWRHCYMSHCSTSSSHPISHSQSPASTLHPTCGCAAAIAKARHLLCILHVAAHLPALGHTTSCLTPRRAHCSSCQEQRLLGPGTCCVSAAFTGRHQALGYPAVVACPRHAAIAC
jgi:hypothetical protein